MEEEYNWNLIIIIAIPIALIEAYVFYTSITDVLKWFSLIIGLLIAGALVYIKDKKKNNIFTAIGIVLLVALVIRLLKNFGLI